MTSRYLKIKTRVMSNFIIIFGNPAIYQRPTTKKIFKWFSFILFEAKCIFISVCFNIRFYITCTVKYFSNDQKNHHAYFFTFKKAPNCQSKSDNKKNFYVTTQQPKITRDSDPSNGKKNILLIY